MGISLEASPAGSDGPAPVRPMDLIVWFSQRGTAAMCRPMGSMRCRRHAPGLQIFEAPSAGRVSMGCVPRAAHFSIAASFLLTPPQTGWTRPYRVGLIATLRDCYDKYTHAHASSKRKQTGARGLATVLIVREGEVTWQDGQSLRPARHLEQPQSP